MARYVIDNRNRVTEMQLRDVSQTKIKAERITKLNNLLGILKAYEVVVVREECGSSDLLEVESLQGIMNMLSLRIRRLGYSVTYCRDKWAEVRP